MTLVDKQDKVVREKVEQRIRRLPRHSSVKVAGIVFDSAAIAHFADHFHVVIDAFLQALRFEQFSLFPKRRDRRAHIGQNLLQRAVALFLLDDIVARRIQIDVFERTNRFARHRIELIDRLDFVPPKRDAHRVFGTVYRKHFDHVAAHPKRRARKLDIAALVLDFDEAIEQRVPIHFHARTQRNRHREIFDRRAQSVNARDGCDDDHVSRLAQRARRGVPQFVDLVVDGQILFDIRIRPRNIGLRLIVIVIGHKIFDAVVGEKFAKLVAQLRGKRLVVRNNKSRSAQLLDYVRHREGLAAARNAEQHLRPQSVPQSLRQFLDRLRLIPARLEFGNQFEHYAPDPIIAEMMRVKIKLPITPQTVRTTLNLIARFSLAICLEKSYPPCNSVMQ